jgi:hypothetical protein
MAALLRISWTPALLRKMQTLEAAALKRFNSGAEK